jgi:hypothetical protein
VDWLVGTAKKHLQGFRMARTSWSMKEFQQALRMKRRGATCADIGAALGRSAAAVEAKFKYCGKTPVTIPITRSPEEPTSAIEEQIKRNAAHHRDLTGAICGDPPAGYLAAYKNGSAPASQFIRNEAVRNSRRRASRTLATISADTKSTPEGPR